MQKFDRSIRRHHRDRLSYNRKNYHRMDFEKPNTAEVVARYIDTPTPCSCMLCGNPRRRWGQKTHKENAFYSD